MIRSLLRSEHGRALIVSHRGCEFLAPENSWEGIKLAHERGADLIEIDCQVSGDDVVFLRHPYELADGTRMHSVHWADLKDIEFDGHTLPRLDEVLDWAVAEDVSLALDLKAAFIDARRLGKAVLDSIDRAGAAQHVMLLGFDHVLLRWLKDLRPEIPAEVLIRGRALDIASMVREVEAEAIALYYDLIQPEDVEAAHAAGIAVTLTGMWRPDFAYAESVGADLIVWGDPLEARQALGYDAPD